MDNVLADVSSQFLRYYGEATGIYLRKDELIGKGESEAFPDAKLAGRFVFQPGFFRSVPIMEGSRDVVRQLNERYEVFIVSAAMEFPNSFVEKYDWLAEHFPFISWQQIVFCGSKRIIKADYLIDDYPKNLDFFEGEKLLFTAPHNQLLTGYKRLNNWQEVSDLLLG